MIAFSASSQIKQLGTDTIRINVTVAKAKTIVDTNAGNPDFIILDIRTPSEFMNGHIANAVNINSYDPNFSGKLDSLDHNKMYLLHCASGGRSTPTFALMQSKHFREIYHLSTGFNSWVSAGYPYVTGTTNIANENENTPKLFPNPITEESKIIFNKRYDNLILEIYNISGEKQLYSQYESASEIGINKSNLKAGVYFLKIVSSGKLLLNDKIIIAEGN